MQHLVTRIDLGHHALVAMGAGHAIEARGIGRNDAHASGFSLGQQIAGTRVVTLGGHMQFENRLRIVPQLGGDGVKAMNETGVSHDGFLSWGPQPCRCERVSGRTPPACARHAARSTGLP